MLHTKKPEIFNPSFEVVSCFVEYNNKFLLLLRQDHKNEPNTYWVPAGKINSEEHKEFIWRTPQDALNEDLIPELDTCIKLFYNL